MPAPALVMPTMLPARTVLIVAVSAALVTVIVEGKFARVSVPGPLSEYPPASNVMFPTVIPPASTAIAPPAVWKKASFAGAAELLQVVSSGPVARVDHVIFVVSQLPAPPVGEFQ